MKLLRQIAIIIALLLFGPLPAFANVGLPMLVVVLPGMVVTLIPIIIIESWYCHRSLKLPYRRALKVMSIVNLESTLFGIPMAWIAWVLIEGLVGLVVYLLGKDLPAAIRNSFGILFNVTIGAAWLAPVESQAYWMVPTASFVLLIPFFYVSWFLERSLARRFLQEYTWEDINRATFTANLYSYSLLGAIALGWLIVALGRGGGT